MKVSNLYPRNISLCGHRKPHYLKPITQLLSARLFEFSSFSINSSRSRFWAEACLCSQVWRQKACIASAGTRRTRTTSRNSLIKVTQTHTHTCTESHNLTNTHSATWSVTVFIARRAGSHYFSADRDSELFSHERSSAQEFLLKHVTDRGGFVWCVQ